jgi:uncharacterized membrane protein YkvA (DUF1232 family)
MNKEDLLVKVLKSVFFKIANNKAGKIAGSSFLILKLLREALEKASGNKDGGSLVSALLQKVTLLGRMLKAYAKGDYKDLPSGTLLKILASLLYFVSPIDLLPDFLPLLGLTDDVALLFWVVNSINDDIARFDEWEKTGAETV